MNPLRSLSTKRLIAGGAIVTVVAVGGAAVAGAAMSGGPTPPPQPLANALHDISNAQPVQGVSATIHFTNNLIAGGTLAAGTPLLTGADGRMWISNDGRARIELQDPNGMDAQIGIDNGKVTVYDAGSNSAYTFTMPSKSSTSTQPDSTSSTTPSGPPTVASIESALTKLAPNADVSGANPTNIGGQPAYQVRVSPNHDGGLLGGVELAWDASRGIPLQFAVYATGNASPVLELKATGITYGPVSSSDLTVAVPADAKVTDISSPTSTQQQDGGTKTAPVTGLDAVQAAVPFKIAAPDTLVGLPRKTVRLVGHGSSAGALVAYGQGLGGILVIEQPVDPAAKASSAGGSGALAALPAVSIAGAKGTELPTALGTVITVERDGVRYIVAGSMTASAAEAAARALLS